MSPQTLLLSPIVIPLAAAFLVLPFLRKKPALAALATLAAVVLSVLAFVAVPAGAPAVNQPWLGNFTLSFSLTAWKALLLAFVLVFQLMTAIYLVRFIHAIPKPYLFLTLPAGGLRRGGGGAPDRSPVRAADLLGDVPGRRCTP